MFGASKLDERSKVFHSSVYVILSLLGVTRELGIHLPNRRSLLSHSRIRSQTITTPIPCSLSKDPLSYPPTLYSTERKIFLNQDFSVTNPREVRSYAEKSQVQSCRVMICFSCKRRKTAASRRMRKCTEKEIVIVSMTRESWGAISNKRTCQPRRSECDRLHQSSLQIKAIDGVQSTRLVGASALNVAGLLAAVADALR